MAYPLRGTNNPLTAREDLLRVGIAYPLHRRTAHHSASQRARHFLPWGCDLTTIPCDHIACHPDP
jgi:hypothetical protein